MVAEFITHDKEHLPGSRKTDVTFYLPYLNKPWLGKPFSVACDEPSTPVPTIVMSQLSEHDEDLPSLTTDSLLQPTTPDTLSYLLVVNIHHDGQNHNAYLDINLL